MLKRTSLIAAAFAALVLTGAAATQAELIYGFETTGDPTSTGAGGAPDGFTSNYFSSRSDSFTQSTTGVTQGTHSGALTITTPNSYNQADITTAQNPADLQSASQATFDVLVSAPGDNYVTVQAIEYIEGPPGSGAEYRLVSQSSTNVANDTAETTSVPLSLLFPDPDAGYNGDSNSTTGYYTVADIAAADSAAEGITYTAGNFQLEFTASGGTTGPALTTVYLDNIQVPSAPEPASLGLIAAGGLLLGRRRRSR